MFFCYLTPCAHPIHPTYILHTHTHTCFCGKLGNESHCFLVEGAGCVHILVSLQCQSNVACAAITPSTHHPPFKLLCGGVWWCVVECGGVWWSVVGCHFAYAHHTSHTHHAPPPPPTHTPVAATRTASQNTALLFHTAVHVYSMPRAMLAHLRLHNTLQQHPGNNATPLAHHPT